MNEAALKRRIDTLEAELAAVTARCEQAEARLEELVGHIADPQREADLLAGVPGALTGRERQLLCMMLRRPGVVFRKEAIMLGLYGHTDDETPEIKIIDVFVHKVRRKIAGGPVEIETVWGEGYRAFRKAAP
jgi:two-component system response regulator TctD